MPALILAMVASITLSAAPPEQEQTPLEEIPSAKPPSPATRTRIDDLPEVRAHVDQAKVLLGDGQVAQAVAELHQGLMISPTPPPELLLTLARAFDTAGQAGAARLAAEHALVYAPESVAVHYMLGALYRKTGRPEDATRHYRSATLGSDARDAPLATAAWYALGDVLSDTGRQLAAAEAFARFDKAIWSEHPEHRTTPEVAELLTRHPYGAIERRLSLLGALGRQDDRCEAARQATTWQPDEPYLQRLYVTTLMEADRPAEAFAYCRDRLTTGDENVTRNSEDSALLSLAIEAGVAANELEDWVATLAEDAASASGTLALEVAQRLDDMDRHRQSIPLWQALAESHPDDPNIVWPLATALREQGDLDAALQALVEHVRASPDGAQIPPRRLAAWMETFTATEEFLSLVDTWTKRPDCDPATYVVLGTTATAAEQTELAERLFAAALEADPEYALAHLAWGRMLADEYRWTEAIAHAEKALSLIPDHAGAHLLLATAYEGLDQPDKAEEAYKAAIDQRPKDPTYAEAIGDFYRRTGNLLGATRYFQQVWSQDRTRYRVVEELVDCYLEGNKRQIAREIVREAEASDVPSDALRRMRTAIEFADQPMSDAHLDALRRQFDKHPDDATTGLRLAAGLYMHQRIDEAKEILDRVEAVAPDSERLRFLQARVHLRDLQAEKAIDLLSEVVRRHPRRRGVLRLLADAQLADFRIEAARKTLRRLLELELPQQQRDELRTELVATYVELMEYDAALELAEEWLDQAADPQQEGLWARAKLRVLIAADRIDDALRFATKRLEPVTKTFREAKDHYSDLGKQLQDNPEDADLQARLEAAERDLSDAISRLFGRRSDFVQVCIEGDRLADAETRLRDWLTDQPEVTQIQEWLVEVLLARKKADEALEVLGQIVPQSPGDVLRAFLWRSRCYAIIGELGKAINDLKSLLNEEYVRENPVARAQVRQELVGLFVEENEYDEALSLIDEWLAEVSEAQHAARAELLMLKRFVYQLAEREDKANEVSQRLLALQPNDPGLNNDLGYTWVDQGTNLDEAIRMIRIAVASEPTNAAFLDSLGWAYYKLGQFDRARKYLSRATQLRDGQDAVLYDHLADAEYRLGNVDAARRHWEKAVELVEQVAPESRVARNIELLTRLRAKLAALDEDRMPDLAPIVDAPPSTPDSAEDDA